MRASLLRMLLMVVMLLTATTALQSPTRTTGKKTSRNPMTAPSRVCKLKKRKRPTRVGRKDNRVCKDPYEHHSYGESVYNWSPGWLRIFFQNAKGLTYSTGSEDFHYYVKCLKDLNVNVSGICETNRAWQHPHLRAQFNKAAREPHSNLAKSSFGYPKFEVDPIPPKETSCAGGSVTSVYGEWVTRSNGDDIQDQSGLGRWSGITLTGKSKSKFTIITAYRVCKNSISQAGVDTSFAREHEHFKETGVEKPDPRKQMLTDLQVMVKGLQKSNHKILLMMDANERMEEGSGLDTFAKSLNLTDLQGKDPAQSTYILEEDSRLDYMFGCPDVVKSMVQQGTLAYSIGPASDHRGIFADLSIKAILGADTKSFNMRPAKARLLNSGHPVAVKAYLAAMHDYYEAHDMVKRIERLHRCHHSMTKEQVRKHLNRWDRDQGRAMLAAEAALRKPPQPYKWSDRLRNAALLRRYWKFRLTEIKDDLCYDAAIKLLEDRIRQHSGNYTFPLRDEELTIAEVRVHYNAATKELSKVQLNAEEYRIQNQYDQLAVLEADRNPATMEESHRMVKIIERNIQGETTRNMFQSIGNVVKPRPSGGVQKVLIPKHKDSSETTKPEQIRDVLRDHPEKDLVWEHVADADEMEKYLLHYNRQSFRAAAESPCGHGIIHDAMSFSSLTPEGEELLQGKIPKEWYGDDDLLREFLASFAIPKSTKEAKAIRTKISEADFIYGIKNWSERTSTSPSGRHLGHYKSMIQDPTILRCQVIMMNIAIQHGIALDRWSNSVTVMIEKDPGDPKINRLRIIHLFEADFNLFLKLQWGSRLVKRAVKKDLLNSGQYGSTPGKVAMDPVMLAELTTDLSRLLKVNLARFDNDASACYDRIIVMLGMLAARRCGQPENAVSTHAEALRLMKYAIKTVHGVTEKTYHGTPFEVLFGTGQGSGASPAVWLTLVVILMNTVDRLTPECMYFASPNGSIKHSRRADAFVDDTALGFSDYGTMTYHQMVEKLQEIAQRWEKLLHYSGGSLNLKKCFWFVMYWKWHNGRPICRTIEDEDPTVTLTQGSNPTEKAIKNTPLTKASEMLGVWLSPNGNFSKHLEVMKTKADTFSVRIRSSRLSAHNVTTFHKTMYFPSMRYSLAALAVDEEELHLLQQKIAPTILQRLGASEKTALAIRHGPKEFAGMDITDLRTELGVEMIQCLRHSVYARTEVGKMILINLAHSQQEAGIGPLLMEHPSTHISYVTPTWITSVRQFMSNHNITLTFTEDYGLKLKTKNDKFIMNLEALACLPEEVQYDINLVRIHLQVNSLAEISDVKGKRILETALKGQRHREARPDTEWPRQPGPTSQQTFRWKEYLTSVHANQFGFLKRPVGTASSKPTPNPPPKPHQCANLPEALSLLDKFQHRLIERSEQVATDTEVWNAFRSKRRLEIITDGGLKDHNATFGWKIITPDRTVLFQGSGPADGPPETESSTRSELFGFAAPMIIVNQLARWWGIKHRCKFRWLVDSQAAIKQVKDIRRKQTLPRHQPENVDVLTTIFHLTKECRRPITIDWVKGHQDDDKHYDELSRDAQLNIDVDRLATNYRESGGRSRAILTHYPPTQVSVSINNIRLPGKIEPSIRYHVNGSALKQYVTKFNKWDAFTARCVDWYSFGLNFRTLVPKAQLQHMKLVHDIQPLGWKKHQISKSKETALSMCPCCKAKVETSVHFLTCPTQRPSRYRHLVTLQKSMGAHNDHPALTLLFSGINQWLRNPMEPPTLQVHPYPTHLQPILAQAINEQDQIGWHQALKGFLTTSWASAAAVHPTKPRKMERDKGQHRITQTLRALRTYTDNVWLDRNDVLHRHEDAEVARILSVQDSEIRHYHTHPHLLPERDRHYCKGNLDKLLKSKKSIRRRWLLRVRRSRNALLERQRKKRQTLHHHFKFRRRIRVEIPTTTYTSPTRLQTTLTGAPANSVPPDRPVIRPTTYISPIRKQMTLTTLLKPALLDD